MSATNTVNGCRVTASTEFYLSPGLRPARIILVQRGESEYVTAYHCAGDSSWAWGHYFDNLTDAFDDYVTRAAKHRIGKDLASEQDIAEAARGMREADRQRAAGKEPAMSAEPCTLIYAPDGFAWVRYGELGEEETRPDTGLLSTGKSRFPTLMAAYTAAAEAGHRPTRWVNPAAGVPMALDQAAHWLRLAGLSSEETDR